MCTSELYTDHADYDRDCTKPKPYDRAKCNSLRNTYTYIHLHTNAHFHANHYANPNNHTDANDYAYANDHPHADV